MSTKYAIDWGDGSRTVIGEDRAYAVRLLREASGPFLAKNPPPSVIEVTEPKETQPMTTTPTVEEFLAQQDPEEDQTDEQRPADPLESIAQSLGVIADAMTNRDTTAGAEQEALLEETREERDDWEDKHRAALDLIHEIGTIVKPSTSKVSLEVKAAIERWANPVVEPEPITVPDGPPDGPHTAAEGAYPAQSADVEEWRAYARSYGYTGPDVDSMNRSQIRTMLGIPHTTQED